MQITSDLFSFPFKDERWKSKFAIGALFGLIGMVFFPVFFLFIGYGVRVMRHTIRGQGPDLPDWDDWGEMIMDGLRHLAVSLVYSIPLFIMLCIVTSLMLGMMGLTGVFNPDLDPDALSLGITLSTFMWMGAFGIAMLISLPFSFLSMVALTRAIALDRLSAAFEFGEVWRLTKAGMGNFVLAAIIWFAVLFGLSFAVQLLMYTIILCIFYPLFYGLMYMYSYVIYGALLGLAYKATMRSGKLEGTPSLPAPAKPKPATSKAAAIPPAPAAEMPAAATSTAVSAPTPPPPVPPAPAPEPIKDTAVEASAKGSDDLTLINGIGPVFAKRLIEAGISTYAQLAAQSPDRLREITQARATANPQVWIDEARRRASA
jgi:predicted flap endonuclease-1-like 5' DNA nuclease